MTKHTIVLKPGDTLVVSCKGMKGGNNIVEEEEEEFVIEESSMNNNSTNNNSTNNNNSNNMNMNSSNNSNSNSAAMGGKRLNKTRKNKKVGGKAVNPYMNFANKYRSEILKENPELKSDVKAVARKLGEKWRSMSDAEKAKY